MRFMLFIVTILLCVNKRSALSTGDDATPPGPGAPATRARRRGENTHVRRGGTATRYRARAKLINEQ